MWSRLSASIADAADTAPKYNSRRCEYEFGFEQCMPYEVIPDKTGYALDGGLYDPWFIGHKTIPQPLFTSFSLFLSLPMDCANGYLVTSDKGIQVKRDYVKPPKVNHHEARWLVHRLEPSRAGEAVKEAGEAAVVVNLAYFTEWTTPHRDKDMIRIPCQERSGWREKADEFGFKFHTMYGQPYWDESAYYQFTLKQIEQQIEDPTAEFIHALGDKVVHDEHLLRKFQRSLLATDRRLLARRSTQFIFAFRFSFPQRSPCKTLGKQCRYAHKPLWIGIGSGYGSKRWWTPQDQQAADQFNSLQENWSHSWLRSNNTTNPI